MPLRQTRSSTGNYAALAFKVWQRAATDPTSRNHELGLHSGAIRNASSSFRRYKATAQRYRGYYQRYRKWATTGSRLKAPWGVGLNSPPYRWAPAGQLYRNRRVIGRRGAIRKWRWR